VGFGVSPGFAVGDGEAVGVGDGEEHWVPIMPKASIRAARPKTTLFMSALKNGLEIRSELGDGVSGFSSF
jgi:hypothetical protein